MKWTWDELKLKNKQPQGIELESVLLGSMMLCPDSCDTAFELLQEGDFSLELHRVLFSQLRLIYEMNESIDLRTFRSALESTGVYGEICDATDLSRVFTSVEAATPTQTEIYARMILEFNL